MKQQHKYKKIVFSASPLVLSGLLDIAVSMFALFLLKPYGPDVMAAFGIGIALLNSSFALCFGIQPAIIAILSRFSLNKKYSEAVICYSGTLFSFFFGIIVFILFEIELNVYVTLCPTSPAIIEHVISYLKIMRWLAFLVTLNMITSAIIIFKDKTLTVLKCNLFVRLFSVPILWIILSPKFGFIGDISTVAWIGFGVSLVNFIFFTYIIFKEIPSLISSFRLNIFSTYIMKQISYIAVPAGLKLFLALTHLSVFLNIISILGAQEAAISTAIIGFLRFLTFPIITFATITGTFAASSFNRFELGEGKRWIRAGIELIYFLSMPFFLVLFLTPDFITSYLVDPSNITKASFALRIASLVFLFEPISGFLAQVLVTQGIGKQVLLVSSIYQWVVELPLCYFIGIHLNFGLTSIWFLHLSSQIVFAIGCIIIYRNFLNKLQDTPVFAQA